MGLLDGLTGMLGGKKQRKSGFSTGNAIIDALLPMLLAGAGGKGAKAGGLGALGALLGKTSGGRGGRSSGGGLADLLGDGGGLGGLLSQLQSNGLGAKTQSWVSAGPNEALTPEEVEKGLGADVVDRLAAQTGMARGDVTGQLTTILPGLVDNLTPDGNVPDQGQLGGLLQNLDLGKILGGR